MDIISAYRFCPRCGSEGLNRTANGGAVCASCEWKLHPTPVVAVGVIICDAEQRVLLIRRSREPGKGLLGIPGGFVDFDETAEQAARRETWEEVRLEIDNLRYLLSHPNDYVYQGVTQKVLDVFFIARAVAASAARAADGVEEVLFLPAQAIPWSEIAFGSIRRALRMWASP